MKLLTGALLALISMPAAAEVRPSNIAKPTSRQGFGPGYGDSGPFVQLETALSSTSDGDAKHFVVSPLLKFASRVGTNEVEFQWGFVNFSLESPADQLGDRSTFRIMNPYAGYYWTWRSKPRQLRIGLGAAAPVAQVRTDRAGQTAVDTLALSAASAIRGHKSLWLWAPERFSIVNHYDYYVRTPTGWIIGGELDLAELLGVGDETRGTDRNDFHVQALVEGAFETGTLRPALRVGYANTLTSDADDADQISVEAETRIRLNQVDLIAGFTLPIDGPAGFGFDDGKYWGVMLGISSRTEARLPEPED